ncbi:hypothetical protein LXL04_014213 [Taraxacum kok-saghyz]
MARTKQPAKRSAGNRTPGQYLPLLLSDLLYVQTLIFIPFSFKLQLKHQLQLQPVRREEVRERFQGVSSGTGERQKQKPHRFKPGTQALREIRRLQKTVNLLIPVAPFVRTVKEISNYIAPEVTRWQAEALQCLQEAAEDYLIQLFEDSMLCAIHAKRVTLSKFFFNGTLIGCARDTCPHHLFKFIVQKDLALARRLTKKGQPW